MAGCRFSSTFAGRRPWMTVQQLRNFELLTQATGRLSRPPATKLKPEGSDGYVRIALSRREKNHSVGSADPFFNRRLQLATCRSTAVSGCEFEPALIQTSWDNRVRLYLSRQYPERRFCS